MKQQTIFIILAGLPLLFSSCRKPDETAPQVTLNGGNVLLFIGGTYSDQGAVATDNKDGDLTSRIEVTNLVNTTQAGSYTVHYSVTDNAGNEGKADRTVIIKNTAFSFGGSYAVKDSIWGGAVTLYFDSIIVSNSVNDRLFTTRFANHIYGTVYMDLVSSGTMITVPSQAINCGTPNDLRTFSTPSNGTVGGIPTVIRFNYQEVNSSGTVNATATYTAQ